MTLPLETCWLSHQGMSLLPSTAQVADRQVVSQIQALKALLIYVSFLWDTVDSLINSTIGFVVHGMRWSMNNAHQQALHA